MLLLLLSRGGYSLFAVGKCSSSTSTGYSRAESNSIGLANRIPALSWQQVDRFCVRIAPSWERPPAAGDDHRAWRDRKLLQHCYCCTAAAVV